KCSMRPSSRQLALRGLALGWAALCRCGFKIGLAIVAGEGLCAAYAIAKPRSAIFREVGPIEGFPAVAYKDSEDAPRCAVVVGLADDYAISATVSLSFEKENAGVDSCGPAERIAATVVGNLKDRAGE